MINRGKQNLLGVNVHAVDYESAVRQIVEAARARKPFGVSALAVHGVMTGVMDEEHRHRLNALEMVVPDGQPVRWGLNLLHQTGLRDRVYGPNLMLKVCETAASEGLSVFLFGGKQELLDRLKARLLEKFPGLKIAGSCASKFRQLSVDEKSAVIQQINESGANITLVGLGCPRQEVWAYEFKDHLRMPVLAVGAAFNFHAGELDQAPSLLQRAGLEWFYRFWKEPKRLWRRYVILNPYYLWLLFGQWSGLKKFNPDQTSEPGEEVLYG